VPDRSPEAGAQVRILPGAHTLTPFPSCKHTLTTRFGLRRGARAVRPSPARSSPQRPSLPNWRPGCTTRNYGGTRDLQGRRHIHAYDHQVMMTVTVDTNTLDANRQSLEEAIRGLDVVLAATTVSDRELRGSSIKLPSEPIAETLVWD
jgi:hypothetical protein